MSFGPAQWGFDESLADHAASGQYWGGRYSLNGNTESLPKEKYLPDLTHDFVVDFIKRHKEKPFFIYYPMIHIHIPILPTPDSTPDANPDQLYSDNVTYHDKLVGKLIAELDVLNLRGNTLIVYASDNGSIRPPSYTPLKGRFLSGRKASIDEGGSHVPMIVNWSGTTPAGVINRDLVDFSDFFSTFVEMAGAALPAGATLDSHSFLPQIKGEKGTPRDWVYVELDGRSYTRDAAWKLTNAGDFFDLKDAPYTELASRRYDQCRSHRSPHATTNCPQRTPLGPRRRNN